MSQKVDYLSRCVAAGRLSRREFLGPSSALGLNLAPASTLLAGAAKAQVLRNGGFLKAGLQGGAATDSRDQTSLPGTVPLVCGKWWRELLIEPPPDLGVEYRIAEEISSSMDGKTRTMKVLKGIQFHNGEEVTPQDNASALVQCLLEA
ncbi:hypothetical protein C1D09_016240 [Mesorhizobium intechi]|uniref:hypothetical protein n=1 Tax=Mesorhizobium intechi TaxID=537601 RepID=UPI000CC27247|nr:hypothetical protein [Mesorhizobium intechi]TSE09307.1 hypothetical protein C1D09_016240 [Mesorhizobium intechi]